MLTKALRKMDKFISTMSGHCSGGSSGAGHCSGSETITPSTSLIDLYIPPVPKKKVMNSKRDIPTGWVCPKCGSVYSPSIAECKKCND